MPSPRAPAGPVAPAAFSHPNVDRITLLSIRPPPSGYLRSCCGTLRRTSPSHSPSRPQLPPVRFDDHLHAGAQHVALTHLHGIALGDRMRLFARVRHVVVIPVRCCGERSEEHMSELQSRGHLVCRLLLEKRNYDPASSAFTHTA